MALLLKLTYVQRLTPCGGVIMFMFTFQYRVLLLELTQKKNMKKYLIPIVTVVLLASCASPKFAAKPISTENKLKDITVVKDDATREVFLDTIESWCLDESYECKFVPDRTKHVAEELTLNYVSRWSWDFTTFIADAEIKAYKNKQLVGEVTFKAPNSLDMDKFGDDKKRIKTMVELLFGSIEESEANIKLSDGKL